MLQKPIIYTVIPCYNEQDVIEETVKRLTNKYNLLISKDVISSDSRIMLVNDGSKDRTWEIIEELFGINDYVVGVDLAKNKGHQYALLCGLMTAKEYADAVISMDADLQDDIEVMDKFIESYKNGAQIVYGVRNNRKKDSFFKRNTAIFFYKTMSRLGVETIYNHADYRLMSKRALDELENFKEVNLFLRGIIPMIGFKTDIVEYERAERFAGESKYPLSKMISFAVEGITSCSVKPIRMITSLGFFGLVVSFISLICVILGMCFGDITRQMWLIITVVCLIGSLQIMCTGIIGEYIGKIYNETKKRPRYIINKTVLK